MSSHLLSLALYFLLGTTFLEEFFVHAYIPFDQEFPMGMGYDEGFNIKKVKAKTTPRKTIGSFRLPRSVIPIHYDLEIRPILANGSDVELNTAPGKVRIRILANEPTNSITLHVKTIWIDNHAIVIKAISAEEQQLNITGHNRDDERSFYTIFLDGDLNVGMEYNLTIPFRAKMPLAKAKMAGLYRTTFMGSDGNMKTGVVTQFQKDDASRAFPCFDEPNLKAEFTIRIGRLKENYQSFCNMPRAGEPTPIDGLNGWVWDSYEKTMKIPTYLVAMSVMPDYVAVDTPQDLYRIPVKTWVPKAERTNTSVQFSAEAAGRIMTFFEELFEIPFFINKMENLAVPDIELMAMEHPGLVTYRTNLLVWRKGMDTQFELFTGAQLIAHEFAHQWFGNLVTCNWWNDFWLNEAFARYYQFIGADMSGMNFRAQDRFVIDVVQWAMEFDEGPETVCIRNDETDKVFYQPFHIEYEKGAAVIRMMETILTHNTYIKGLRKYFKKHAFQNTVQDDLFNALDAQAKEDKTLTKFTLGQVMKPWMTKAGYPVLLVTRADHRSIFISQQRFIMHPAANDKIEPGLWHVPIWYITQSNPTIDMDNSPPARWLDKDTLTTYIRFNLSEEWVVVNPQARGYYRVVYDRTLTDLIVKQLVENHTVFDFATRSQLFDDHFRAARARYIGTSQAFQITTYLQNEDDMVVWVAVFNNLRKIYQRIIDTPIIEMFKKFMLSLINPPLKRLGLYLPATASPSDIMLHQMFMDWLCTLEDSLCEEVVRSYMTKWMNDTSSNPVPVDLTSIVYCAAVAHIEDQKAHDFFKEMYRTDRNARHRTILVRALTCDKDKDYLKGLVEIAINPAYPEINTTEHGLVVLTNVMRNPNGRNLVWETIKVHAKNISETLGPMAIPKVIQAIAPYMSNKGESKLNYEIVDFIQNYIIETNSANTAAHESLQKSAQVLVDNSMWMDSFYDDIRLWLTARVHDAHL